MAVITEARLVGDWRRIVGDHVVSYENVDQLDDVGVTGTVTLTPNFGKGPQGVLADDAALYTAHEIKCRVMWGRLHDNDLNNPWQDLIVAVDGKQIVWTAAFSLTYKWRSDVQAQKIALPQVTFDMDAVTAGQISLTSLIPSAQIPSNYEPYLVSAQASAQVASDAKTVAELSAQAADQAKVDATLAKTAAETAKTDAETAAALATTEADRAVGLATAQDQAVADTVTAGGPTTTALNDTYGQTLSLADVPTVTGDGTSDDTAAIQAIIDQAATKAAKFGHAARLVANPGTTYKITSITLRSKVHLDLNGATLTTGANVNGAIMSPGMTGGEKVSDCSVSNGTIVITSTSTYGGVFLRKAEGVVLRNLHISGLNPDSSTGVRLDTETTACEVDRCTIVLPVTTASTVGVSCNSTTVDGKSGGENATLTFQEPTLVSSGHRITRNTITDGTHGVLLHGANNIRIEGNRCTGQSHRAIILSPRSSRNYIAGNTLVDFYSTGIHMAWGSSHNHIAGNWLTTTTSSSEGDGIKGYFGCSYNTVVGNTIVGVTGSDTGAGIRFAAGSKANTIVGNVIQNCLIGILVASNLAAPTYYQPTTIVVGTTITGNVIQGQLSMTGPNDKKSTGISLCEKGDVDLRRVVVVGNQISTVAVGVEVLEETIYNVNSLIVSANSVDATTPWVLPRATQHFSNASANEGLRDVTRTGVTLAKIAGTPAAPEGHAVTLAVREDTAGKPQLVAVFPNGSIATVATHP